MRLKTLTCLAIAGAFVASASGLQAKTKTNFSGTSFGGSKSYYKGYGYKGKTTVSYSRKLKPGTIVISTKERRLYYVLGNGKAIKYGVGVGRKGFSWRGRNRITRKVEWPTWTPPAEMRAREAKKGRKLPITMKGGPRNPLGARAMYLGNTLYRIHGTNASYTIGGAVSSGCIRMLNKEVKDLYKRVRVGTLVIVE